MKIQNAASILLLATLASKTVFAEENAAEIAECDSKDTCEDCLNLGFCDYYHGWCSHNTLVIMDIARYTIDSGDSVDEICARAATDKADDDLCASQTDCAGCTSAILTDGVTSCKWFEEYGFCNAGCNMLGCGVTTCASEPSLLPEVPEMPVFPEVPETPEMGPTPPITGVDIDKIACEAQTEAFACESTELMDPYSSCIWLEEESSCGILTKTSTIDAGCKDRKTCDECVVDRACSWVPALFYESYPCTEMSCDLVADPNCFSKGDTDMMASDICLASETQVDGLSGAGGIGHKSGILFVLAVLSMILQ